MNDGHGASPQGARRTESGLPARFTSLLPVGVRRLARSTDLKPRARRIAASGEPKTAGYTRPLR